MVVIRLQRGGANKRPFYHVVVADSRRAASGKFIERLGFYDPKAPQGREALRVNMERVKHWTAKGAQLSPTAKRLVQKFDRMHLSSGHRTLLVIDDADLLPKEELRLYVTVFRDLPPEPAIRGECTRMEWIRRAGERAGSAARRTSAAASTSPTRWSPTWRRWSSRR